MRTQPVAVAYCPDEPFLVSRHQLAMHRTDVTAGVDVDHAGVQAVSAAIGGTFHDAQVNRDRMLPGRITQAVEVACLDAHRLFDVVAVQLFLQVGFEHRKAEKWKNVLYLIWRFLSEHGGLQAAWLAARMQATLLVSRNRDSWLYQRLRKGNTTRRTEAVCSRTLGGAVRMVITPYGGLSLDADNEDDFRVLNTRFEEWISVPPAE